MSDPPPGEAGECPDTEQLALFAGGRLEGEELVAVRDHARDCDDCGQVLAAFTRAPSVPPAGVDAVADTAFAFSPAAGGPSLVRVRVGDLVQGKYRVDGIVGAGGMGVVVAATHIQIGREVALKFMRPEACESTDAVTRFVREARSIAQIQSEHVARLLDVGTLETGEPFMVMELLKGSDLSNILRKQGPLPVEEAVDFVLQSGEAIAEAHRLGIVHRDLKPANLFVTRRPDGTSLLKVLDFGISKLSSDSVDSVDGLTTSRAALGSPRYMSPEQLRSPRTVGPTTDVWALGCILYELLTAQFAFDGETLHGVALAIATGATPKVREVRPEAPGAVEQVVLACLVKDAAKRVQSIADLALLLAPLAPARSRLSIERICRLTGRPPPLTVAETGHRGFAVPVVAAVLAVGAIGVATLGHRAPRPTLEPPRASVPLPTSGPAGPSSPALPPESIPPPQTAIGAAPTTPSASASSATRSLSRPPRPRAPATTPLVTSASPDPAPVPPPTNPSALPDSMQHGLQDRK